MNHSPQEAGPAEEAGSLSGTALFLVDVWGTALNLESCCLLMKTAESTIGSACWCSSQGAAWRAGEQECSCHQRTGLVLTETPEFSVLLNGEPVDRLWSMRPEWRVQAAAQLERAWSFACLLRKQKLAALAEFAAGAGHEINNPLATIVNRTRQLLLDEEDPERRRWLETIGAQAYRIRDMIGDTMLFARPPQPVLESVDLLKVIPQVTSRFAAEFQDRQIRLFIPELQSSSSHQPVKVLADPNQLKIVLAELFRNALAAVGDRTGVINLSVSAPLSRPGFVKVTLTDNGPGLSPTEAEHLFDPFFSGRQAGRGLGFGLSKCWRIVQIHGGTLQASPQPSGGLQMTLTWPAPMSHSVPGIAS